MRISLSPLGRDFALYLALGIVAIVIVSMLDEILYTLRTRPIVELRAAVAEDNAIIIDNAPAPDTVEVPATARGKRARTGAKGGDRNDAVSVTDTPTS